MFFQFFKHAPFDTHLLKDGLNHNVTPGEISHSGRAADHALEFVYLVRMNSAFGSHRLDFTRHPRECLVNFFSRDITNRDGHLEPAHQLEGKLPGHQASPHNTHVVYGLRVLAIRCPGCFLLPFLNQHERIDTCSELVTGNQVC